MKILVVAPTPFFSDRGCHVRIYEEIINLSKVGHEIELCTYHIGRNVEGVKIFRTPNIPWYNKLEAGPSLHKIYIDFFLLILVFIRCIIFNPDVIHAHLHEGILAGKFSSLVFRIPIIFDVQGSLTNELIDHNFINRKSIMYYIIRFLEKITYNISDSIITSSTKTCEFITKEFKLKNKNIIPLIDGIGSNSKVYDNVEIDTLKENLGISGKDIVVFLGLLNKYQGIDLLLESICITKEVNTNIHYVIMGFPNIDQYTAQSVSLGISEFITFTGAITYFEINKYLSLGDIAISPKISMSEGNGKLYNYLANGLLSVVFENEINYEILGEYAVYAIYNDVYSLSQKTLEALNIAKSQKNNELSLEMINFVYKKHHWSLRINQLMDIYNELLKKNW